MTTPDSRSKFRSNYRHYHRHRVEDPSWKAWVDGEDPALPKRGRKWRKLGLVAGVLLLAGIIAFFCLRGI